MSSQTSGANDNAPSFEPCVPGTLSDKLRLKSLLKRRKATLTDLPDDKKSATLEHKGRKLIVRDAVFFGHRRIVEGYRFDENIDALLAEILADVPQPLIDEYTLSERQRHNLCFFLDHLLSNQDEWMTDPKDGVRSSVLEYLRNTYTPWELQHPNLAVLTTFMAVDADRAHVLLEMNKQFAVIDDDGKIFVHDRITGHEYTPPAFHNAYTPRMVVLEKDANGDERRKTVKKSKLWFESNVRPVYTRRRLYPMGRNTDGKPFRDVPATAGHFNTWKGFAAKPKKGKCDLFMAHIRDIICDGNAEYFEYVMDWFAHRFQKPWEKPRTALVFCSQEKQIGKSIVGDEMRNIIGTHAAIVDKEGHINGRFANTTKYIFIQSEEALFSGDPRNINLLKNAITSPTQRVESKNDARGEEEDYPSYTGYLFISNEEKPVHVTPDETRFFILRVSPARYKDKAYFDAIVAEMRSGGREAFLYELLQRDLSDFAPWVFPESDALGQLALANADKLDKKIIQAIQAGEIQLDDGSTIAWPATHALTIESDTLLKAFGKAAAAYGEDKGSKVVIGRVLQKLDLVERKIDADKRRPNVRAGYVLRPLNEARCKVAKKFKTTTQELGALPEGASVTEREAEVARAWEGLDAIRVALDLPINDAAYMDLKSRLHAAEKAEPAAPTAEAA